MGGSWEGRNPDKVLAKLSQPLSPEDVGRNFKKSITIY